MIKKALTTICKADVEALLTDTVRESTTLDYKQSLPKNDDDSKRDFLADVVAFANTAGGDIIYGVTERRENGKPTGEPESINGLGGANIDQEILRLESSIRSSIEPRVSTTKFHRVDGFVNGPVLILRVEKSYISPHMVTYKNLSRFFARGSNGNYEMDITQIRSAFAQYEAFPERVRNFVWDRISKIIGNQSSISLPTGPKIVIHTFPQSLFDSSHQLDLRALQDKIEAFLPFHDRHLMDLRYNLDGIFKFIRAKDKSVMEYCQIFRNGAIEAVDMYQLNREDLTIKSLAFEIDIVKAASRCITLQRQLGLQFPFFIRLSLLNVYGYRIDMDVRRPADPDSYKIDREHLFLSEISILDEQMLIENALQPLFDSVWQASGFSHSYNYDAKGVWKGKKS